MWLRVWTFCEYEILRLILKVCYETAAGADLDCRPRKFKVGIPKPDGPTSRERRPKVAWWGRDEKAEDMSSCEHMDGDSLFSNSVG